MIIKITFFRWNYSKSLEWDTYILCKTFINKRYIEYKRENLQYTFLHYIYTKHENI